MWRNVASVADCGECGGLWRNVVECGEYGGVMRVWQSVTRVL